MKKLPQQLISLKVNGYEYEVAVRPNRTLLEVLREDLRLTGTKEGCDDGVCGACTVLLEGVPVRSCLCLAVGAKGKEVTTIEGLADGEQLHPVQRAFVDHGAIQCGYCSPGMILTAKALLDRNPAPTDHGYQAGHLGEFLPVHRIQQDRQGHQDGRAQRGRRDVGMEQLSYIGKSVPRKDGPLKATGRAQYTVDLSLPGMLIGKVLRSPHPHARILSIDTSQAEKLPGVKAVVTAADSLQIKHGFVETPRYPADQFPIAVDTVRHVGEDLAGVAAVDEDTAEEALSLIKVEYELLPAVFDPEEAMDLGAPEIHPNHPKVNEPYRNIGGKTETGWGDLEKAFAESYLIREDKYYCQMRAHGYLEPQATVAYFDYSGKLKVWTSSMGVFIKRAKLAKTLGLPYGRVRVLKTYVGGAFGGKIDLFHHEYISALLSMKCHLPVKIVYSREEVFKAARHGQPLIVQLKTGVARDGTILGQEIRTINDSGAYHGSGVVVIFLAWGFAMAPYRVPAMKYQGYSIYTNNLVRAPQRGHGAPKMRFAVESQFDMIAEELGLDPIEFRLRNARKPGEMLPNGDSVKNFGLSECITRVADRTDFKNKYEAARRERETASKIKRGIGIGSTAYFGGSLIYPNSSSVIVKLNDDASVSLMTGALDIGQGCETVLCQIAAEELGVPVDEVQVYAADTETTPVDIGSWISGLTYVTGNATKKAAAQAMKKLLVVAAEELKAEVKDLADAP